MVDTAAGQSAIDMAIDSVGRSYEAPPFFRLLRVESGRDPNVVIQYFTRSTNAWALFINAA
jgi:hypothetical protein